MKISHNALLFSMVIHIIFIFNNVQSGFERKIEPSSQKVIELIIINSVEDKIEGSKNHLKLGENNKKISASKTEKNTINLEYINKNKVESAFINIPSSSIRAAPEAILDAVQLNKQSSSESTDNQPSSALKQLDFSMPNTVKREKSLADQANEQLGSKVKTPNDEFTEKIQSAQKPGCLKDSGMGLLGLPNILYKIVREKCTFN